ncbi:aldehyde ferredoxin oxidoreductase family protein [Candidatus Bathyarchaeota archaeon]|nr:aldehyde ferredoxin oxidoreductase family protein [Candidatus Bathyarchaeota archaeon]
MVGRTLQVDLTDGKVEVIEREDLFDRYLGGDGAAIKLLQEYCPRGIDPLDPEAPIIFTIGPLNAFFPCCTKAVCMFKSPLTGNLGETHAGGRLGMTIRLAGYDAIIIKGRASSPVYLAIHNDKVLIKDATLLWGLSPYAVGRILREVEVGAGRRSIIRIGPAGEQLIRFANVNVDTYRHFGRLGLGAVFGSKMLKAIVVRGSHDIPIKNLSQYRKLYESIYNDVVQTEKMMKYHDMGTAANVSVLNEIKALPTRNFNQAQFENADNISGENFASTYLARKIACPACPIGCIHIAALRLPFALGHEFQTMLVPYDYEPIYALGSNLGVNSPEGILRLIERCDRYGLDAISTGVILGWATEAYERNLISAKDTLGVPLSWGNVDNYLRAIDLAVQKSNEFYSTFTNGVEALASRFGGFNYAMALGGNEVAGYMVGPATIVGQLVGPRHSHLDNAGYSVDEKALRTPLSLKQMVDLIVSEDYWRCLLTTLVICLFARGVYNESVVVEALKCFDIERTPEELKKLGKQIFNEKYAFKMREGFKLSDLRIPKRFFETACASGKIEEKTVQSMLKLYVEKTGLFA